MRQMIREFVEIVSKTLPILEPILEFGALQVPGQEGFADLRPFFPGRQYVGCDMRPGPGVDCILNCHEIGLPPDSTGTVMALDTLEHVEFCRKATDEFLRILRPGGILVISSVMNYPIHDFPYDYWRFTPHAFRSLLKNFSYSFVDSVGEESFPHTVIGIACKGAIPEDSIEKFLKEFSQWKHGWDSAKSWQESAQMYHYYNFSRPEVARLVPETATKVLDVGCAAGAMGKALKERGIQAIVGVEINPEVAKIAASYLDQVIVGDIESIELPFPQGYFDCLVLADVLEHLRDPWSVARKLAAYLADGGTIICSIPNIRNLGIIHSLIEGNWAYTSSGILDRTHLRFFTATEFQKLLSEAGFSVTKLIHVKDPRLPFTRSELSGDSPFSLDYGPLTIRDLSPAALEELTTYQFLMVATKIASTQGGTKATEGVQRQGATLQQAGTLAPLKLKTSIVILTHNQLEYTKPCVDSIKRWTEEPYELIFVDNGSDDGTLEYLRSIPGARVIANAANLGFAIGCNQGIAVASGDYIMLLNNDVVVTDGWLRRMIRWAETTPGVGLVGPMSNYVSGVQMVTPVPYGSDLELVQSFAREFSARNAGKGLFVRRAIGFCLLVKREVVEKIGGLDPRFGTGNFEDDDFCLRAQLAGYRIWIANDVFIHHFGGRTFAGAGIDYTNSMVGNWAIFKAKWGLPPEADLCDGYKPEKLTSEVFDPARHYVPLQPEEKETQTVGLSRYVKEAEEFEALGDLKSSLSRYEVALSLDPNNPAILVGMGRLYLSTGEVRRARGYLEQGIGQDGSNDLTHAYLGLAYLGLGELGKAEESLTKALALNPRLEPARRGLADVFKMQERLPEAVNLLEEIIAGEQATVDDLVALADCYRQAGALDSARIGYEAVTGLDPDHIGARAGLAALADAALKGGQDGKIKNEAKVR